jgi:diguanylate cyclase (GGDEF)-like protein/PAS domain S-box-containing protein
VDAAGDPDSAAGASVPTGAFLESVDFGVAVYRAVDGGRDFEFVYMNPAGCRIAQVAQQEVQGLRLTTLMRGAAEMGLVEALQRVHRSGIPEALPARRYRDDQRDGYYSNHLYALPDGTIAVIYRDVSEATALRREVEEQRERYRLLTSALVEGIWDYDPVTGTTYFSPSWKSQLGYDEDELENSFATFERLIVAEERQAVLAHLAAFVEAGGSAWEHEFHMRHRDGRPVAILARGSAVRGADGRAQRMLGLHIDVSATRSLEADQRQQRALLESLFGVLPDLFLLLDASGTVRQLHTGQLEDLPATPQQIVGRRLNDIFPAPIAGQFTDAIRQALAADGPREISYELDFAGERRWFEARLARSTDRRHVACVVRNISRRMRVRAELATRLHELEVYGQAFDSSQDQLAALDRERRYLMVNAAYAEFFGRQTRDIIGEPIETVIRGEALDSNVSPALQQCLEGRTVTFQEWRHSAAGAARYFNVVYSPLHDGSGQLGVLVSAHDITALHEAQERLETIAHHDPLTGLPNRMLLHIILQRSIRQAARSGERLAVMFIDLDRFKHINDSLGHAAGDEVLRQAAARLRQNLRSSDSLARVGGDEFVAVLVGVSDAADLSALAAKLMSAVAQPYTLGREQARLSCSIGISLYPEDGEDTDELLNFADTAMYEAKEHGRNDWRFYTPAMTEDANSYLDLLARLRLALQAGTLTLVFHPEYSLGSDAITVVEALTRWYDEALGEVPPSRFVQVAERSGLIRDLDFRALEGACAQMTRWQAEGIAPPGIAVNLSHHTLNHSDTPRRIAETLASHGLAPAQLDIEVHQHGILEHPERAAASLTALGELGVGLVIDKFGESPLALRFLQSLHVRTLKLDGSYLADLKGEDNQRLARAMIAMAHALGPNVVVTRVEGPEQSDFLESMTGLRVQGFHLTDPLPAQEMSELLRRAATHTPAAS